MLTKYESQDIEYSHQLCRDPLNTLLLELAKEYDTSTYQGKKDALENLVNTTAMLDDDSEMLTFCGIGSMFAAAASCTMLLTPVGQALALAACVSAISAGGFAVRTHMQVKPIMNAMYAYKALFESEPTVNWAALWHYVGFDKFVSSIKVSVHRFVRGGNYEKVDGDSAMTYIVRKHSDRLNISFDTLVSQLAAIKGVRTEIKSAGLNVIESQQTYLQLETTIQPDYPTPQVQTTIQSATTTIQSTQTEIQPLNTSTRVPTPAMESLRSFPVADRMDKLLKRLKEENFPLESLIYAPLIVAYGEGQSGKSTIVHMLALARMALGIPVEYTTTDEALPIAFDKFYGNAYTSVKESYEVTTALIQRSKPYSLNRAFHFDEVWQTHEAGIDTSPLLNIVLGKGNKTDAYVVLITQNDTLGAIGGQSIKESLNSTRILVEPDIIVDERGKSRPSGFYKVTKRGFPLIETNNTNSHLWKVPDWLKVKNPRTGKPCPVTAMLEIFPELETNKYINNENQIGFTPPVITNELPKLKTQKTVVLQNETSKLQNPAEEKHVGTEETLQPSDLSESVLQTLLNPVPIITPTKEELQRKKVEKSFEMIEKLEAYIGMNEVMTARNIMRDLKIEKAEECRQLMQLFCHFVRDGNNESIYKYEQSVLTNGRVTARIVLKNASVTA